MQIKKEILLFCLLIVLSVSLLIAASGSSKNEYSINKNKTPACCQEESKDKVESPWNFFTSGIFRFSA